jgi:epoxyqueuosine reductase
MRVCPFNRKYKSLYDIVWRWLATSRFRKLALMWEAKRKPRKRLKPNDWWN